MNIHYLFKYLQVVSSCNLFVLIVRYKIGLRGIYNMANDIMYSKDEKEVRRYNVFQGKGGNPSKRGLDLIVTNKRIISKSYINGVTKELSDVRETPLENASGDIQTSVAKKVKVWKVILYIFIALWFFSMADSFDYEGFLGTLFLLAFIAMIVLVVLLFIFPETEGRIYIPGSGFVHDGVSNNVGTTLRGKKGIALMKILKGKDFDLMQKELGFIINELKNGTNPDELIVINETSSQELTMDDDEIPEL